MEHWLEPCLDAEQMRAVDRWAIEERGVPSLELMETAGHGRRRGRRRGRAPRPGAVVVCGKGNNGGDGLVAAQAARRDRATRSRRCCSGPPDELSGDAKANLERLAPARHGRGRASWRRRSRTPASSSTRSSEPASPASRATRPRRRSRRSTQPAAPVVAADIASGVNASTGEVEGARRRGGPDRHLSRPQARPLDRAGQVAHRRAAGGPDRDPRRRARRRRAPG